MRAPAAVRQMCRSLYRATGVPADVERLDDGRWFVALNAGRVRVVGYFTPIGGGELRWGDSTLEIDGQLVMNCEGFDHLREIVRDPDVHVVASLTEVVAHHEPIEPAAPEDAPAAVRHTWGGVAPRLPEGASAALGTQDGGNRWVVEASTPDGIMQLGWINQGGQWVRSSLRVTVEGKTHVVPEDQLELALRLLFGQEDPGVAAPGSMGRPVAAARQTSVEVRRRTVIRT